MAIARVPIFQRSPERPYPLRLSRGDTLGRTIRREREVRKGEGGIGEFRDLGSG